MNVMGNTLTRQTLYVIIRIDSSVENRAEEGSAITMAGLTDDARLNPTPVYGAEEPAPTQPFAPADSKPSP